MNIIILLIVVGLFGYYYPLLRANWNTFNGMRREWFAKDSAKKEGEMLGGNAKWIKNYFGNYECVVKVDSEDGCNQLGEYYKWEDRDLRGVCTSDICWRNEFEDQCLVQSRCIPIPFRNPKLGNLQLRPIV